MGGCGARTVTPVGVLMVAGSPVEIVGCSCSGSPTNPLADGNGNWLPALAGRNVGMEDRSPPPDGPEIGGALDGPDGLERVPVPLGPETGVEGPLIPPGLEGLLLLGGFCRSERRMAGSEPLHWSEVIAWGPI